MPLLLRRALIALLATALTTAALIALAAWAALRVSWAIPDPGASAGPTELLARDGEVIARFDQEIDRERVELSQVAEVARRAVIASEDRRFYEHEGVDPLSLLRAVWANVRTGSIAQGGSTLTQQYVKAAFVGDERTVLRKVREAVIAVQLERETAKDEILERYLNEVYFGRGAYGIEAAARTYFGVSAAELDAAQSATLAQLLPAPSARNPHADPQGARQRRDRLLTTMAETGALSASEARQARSQPLELAEPRSLRTRAPGFVDHVRRQLEHHFGDEVMRTGALTVTTTLDLQAQDALDATVADHLPAEEAGDVEAAMAAVEPASGDILALHGGRDRGIGDFSLATMSRRQNGSSFKPIVYAAALEDGLVDPGSTRPAPGRTTIRDCAGHDGGPITVSGGPGGRLSVREALVQSVNTTYQHLGCELGADRIVAQARRLGVVSPIPAAPAVALGGAAYGGSPLDMASAFATLANEGRHCPARSILEIRGPEGERVEVPPEVTTTPGLDPTPRAWPDEVHERRPERLAQADADCTAATDPGVAAHVTDALVDVVERGTGTRAAIDRPVAGKTGTSQDNKDAWFVGYTPRLSLAVWLGDPGTDGQVDPLPPLGGFSEIYGGTLPARMFADAAEAALADSDPIAFPEPGAVRLGETADTTPPARPVPAPAWEQAPEDATDDEADREPTEPDEPEPQDPAPQDPARPDEGDGADEPPPGEEAPDESDDGDGCFLIFC